MRVFGGDFVDDEIPVSEYHVVGECARSDIRGVVPQYTDTLVTSVDNIEVVQINVCGGEVSVKQAVELSMYVRTYCGLMNLESNMYT